MRGSCHRGGWKWEAIDIGVEGCWGLRGTLGLVRGNGEAVMQNPIKIDYSHSRAITQGIGERLRTSLEEDQELPARLRLQIDRLRQLEGQSQPNVAKPTTRWWARRPRTRS
jgi:hypothetical protein